MVFEGAGGSAKAARQTRKPPVKAKPSRAHYPKVTRDALRDFRAARKHIGAG